MKMLAEKKAFHAFLRPLFRKDWVVYAKPPFGGPEHVLQYLARYTHRVAISNHRIVNFADGKVTFRWKDYAHKNKQRLMTVTAEEFLRRFLLHTLPRGFVRIRFCGFLANRRRGELLPVCRQLLQAAAAAELNSTGCFRFRRSWRMALSALRRSYGPHRKAHSPTDACGDLKGGRASLTRHSNRSSSNRSLAAAGKPEVCPAIVGGPKTNQNFAWQSKATPHFSGATDVKSRPEVHRRLQIRQARGSLRRLNTHSPPASAANAGGFLQTSLSEVIRRPQFRSLPDTHAAGSLQIES